MKTICCVLVCACVELVYAGAICDFKIKQAREGLQAFEMLQNPDSAKLQIAKDELESLLKHCDDDEILRDVQANIKTTKARLDIANENVIKAIQSQDKHTIFQAELAYKIAKAEYIAAKQELLRFKDLQKSSN